MGFKEKLEQYLTRKLGSTASKKQRADACELGYDYFIMISTGIKSPPSDDKILTISKNLGLSDDETSELLAISVIEKAKEPKAQELLDRAFSNRSNCALSHLPANVAPLTMSDRPDNAVIIPPETQSIPIYTIIRAGNGEMGITDADQDDDQRIFISDEYAKSKVFAIRIAGDSMMPEVYDGEIGLFKPINGDQIRDRDIYAVEVEGWSAWVIKFVRQDPSGVIQLISANSSYPVKEINPQIARVTLRGKLVESRRIRK